MSQTVVLKSFAELETFFGPGDPAADPDPEPDDESTANAHDASADLATLLQELETAGTALARIIVRDQEERALAARDLERFDTLVGQQREAESAREQASRICQEAEAFAELAYSEDARTEAERIVAIARKAEEAAAQQASRWREEAERLAGELNLERLLAVRQRQEELEKAKAAAAERAVRLSEILARAKSALDAGQLAEARGLLGQVSTEYPDNPEIASLQQIIARRELAVKVTSAEEAIQAARRAYRRDPAGVIARLASLDVQGLPDEVSRQLFGEWARACRRLCCERGMAEPLRYAPDPGRGAILAKESAEGDYVVVSTLGLGPEWQVGRSVTPRIVERARPLR
ncbi:MAG TPA: hypothetical protein VNF73_04540 [Candidatus Saccharimonadales bacterium]|nr:hypothetical protein [Candidatus Saccharimonadales bacterium]HVC34671.1 hypothetical protein [Chloroflexota bacterium]